MMLTRSSAEHRPEHKASMMLELGLGNDAESLEPGCRRVINTHLRYVDMPPSVIQNNRLVSLADFNVPY